MWHFCQWTWSQVRLLSLLHSVNVAAKNGRRERVQAVKHCCPGATEPLSLSRPGSCDTDGDAAILSLSVETPLSPPGQRHVGVVSTNLQWALKHLVAEPAVKRRKAVLGEV